MSKKFIVALWVCGALLLAVGLIAVTTGPASAQDPAEPIPPETCVICHDEDGAEHQASYDELYQHGGIQVTDLAYEYSSPDTHIVTFNMTKDGAPFDASDADSIGIYFTPWTGTAFQFEPAGSRLTLKGDLTYDGAGGNTSTLTNADPEYANDFGAVDGLIVVYGRDETTYRIPGTRVYQNKYPFAAVLETGAGVDYESAANAAGCEKCHTVPYLKHSYIYAQVEDDPATDFYTCKACHLDNAEGGHLEWQLLVNDPEKAVEYLNTDEDLSIFTPEELEMYAYTISLMNDTHMSHAMEFPYPQSMSNCVTCHEGKLDTVLADANFTVETCKSCHPVDGHEDLDEDGEPTSHDTTEFALKTLLPSPLHDDMDLATEDCTTCHGEGGVASTFSDIHTGYDDMIYAGDLKYSDAISVTIDSADFDGDMLNIEFSAVESQDLEGLDVADIVPTVMVGLYGWDTKDFIVGAHERLFDDNNDGEISRASGDQRALEAEVGAEHPRVTTVSAEDGSWEVDADLSAWTDLIEDGTVKRVEIAVMPELEDADGVVLALDAPSRTFDLAANDFDDDFYSPIVDLEGCHSCHEALATNYHSPDRGGSIVVCRMCHITKADGSHLEMQSRSLDSYVHAIHSMQPFDIDEIDFADPVEALHYEHHIGFPYPTHAIQNCESCHYEGTYNVPDQTKSLPGLISASHYPLEGWDRNIGEVPEYATGPASRACGACHSADLINEDAAGVLIPFNEHLKQGGYLIEAGEDDVATLLQVIEEMMTLFGQ